MLRATFCSVVSKKVKVSRCYISIWIWYIYPYLWIDWWVQVWVIFFVFLFHPSHRNDKRESRFVFDKEVRNFLLRFILSLIMLFWIIERCSSMVSLGEIYDSRFSLWFVFNGFIIGFTSLTSSYRYEVNFVIMDATLFRKTWTIHVLNI